MRRRRVSEVDVHGSDGAGEPNFVRVAFYADTGTLPADTPLIERANLTPLTGLDTGNFVISLSPPVDLAPGTYWLSVQAVEGGGDWRWNERQSQSLHMAAIRAGGAHGYNCPIWVSLTGCFHSTMPPDLSFRLVGSVPSGSGPPAPTPDTSAPVLSASAPHRESLRKGFVTVKDQTNEPATDAATGGIKVGNAAKSFKLRPATVQHGAGTVRLKLKVPKNALKAIRRALRHHRKAAATVTVVSTDAAGNKSAPKTLRIRLRL